MCESRINALSYPFGSKARSGPDPIPTSDDRKHAARGSKKSTQYSSPYSNVFGRLAETKAGHQSNLTGPAILLRHVVWLWLAAQPRTINISLSYGTRTARECA